LNSLPPKVYSSLPRLGARAAYICVLRDIDRDVYRIDSTDHPATYVDALRAEVTGVYGLELISLLETDDLAASEEQLFEAHHARLSDEWLSLDSHQLAELRRSALAIHSHRSLYLSPQRQTTPEKAAGARSARRHNSSPGSYGRASAGRARRSRSMLAYRDDGARNQQQPLRLEDVNDPYTLFVYLNDRLQTLNEVLYRWKEAFLDYMLLWLFVLFVVACALVTLMALVHSYGGWTIGSW